MINFRIGEETVPVILPVEPSHVSENDLACDSIDEVLDKLSDLIAVDESHNGLATRVEPDANSYGFISAPDEYSIEIESVETSIGEGTVVYQYFKSEDYGSLDITLTYYPEEFTEDIGVAVEVEAERRTAYGDEYGDVVLKASYGEDGVISDIKVERIDGGDGSVERVKFSYDKEGVLDFKSEYDPDSHIETLTVYDEDGSVLRILEFGEEYFDGVDISGDDNHVDISNDDYDANDNYDDWDPVD